MNRKLIIIACVSLTLLFAGCSNEAEAQDAQHCESLAGHKFSTVEDAATHIVSATILSATEDRPAVCEARGYVVPQVQIILQLPMQNWNGRLMVRGCGGFGGSYDWIIPGRPATTPVLRLRSAQEALRRGYAVTASNMGHYSTLRDAKWAYNTPQAEIDFGYRATHVNTLAAKAHR